MENTSQKYRCPQGQCQCVILANSAEEEVYPYYQRRCVQSICKTWTQTLGHLNPSIKNELGAQPGACEVPAPPSARIGQWTPAEAFSLILHRLVELQLLLLKVGLLLYFPLM